MILFFYYLSWRLHVYQKNETVVAGELHRNRDPLVLTKLVAVAVDIIG